MAEVHLRRDTVLAKANSLPKGVYHVDAAGVPLGRLAVEIATVLMGKHRPDYTPHVDTGEKVIVTNGAKVGLSGKKSEQRMKLHYTKYPSGLKAETYGSVRERRPEVLISDAVRRMLPKNRLSRVMLKNLEVFPGSEAKGSPKDMKALKV